MELTVEECLMGFHGVKNLYDLKTCGALANKVATIYEELEKINNNTFYKARDYKQKELFAQLQDFKSSDASDEDKFNKEKELEIEFVEFCNKLLADHGSEKVKVNFEPLTNEDIAKFNDGVSGEILQLIKKGKIKV